MASRKRNWVGSLVALTAMVAGFAAGQTPPTSSTDTQGKWNPNLRGFNDRKGRNGNPSTYGSGRNKIAWWVPSAGNTASSAATTDIIVDNTDFADTSNTTIFTGGPYSPNSYGVATAYPSLSAWSYPAEVNITDGSYRPVRRPVKIGPLKADFALRSPAYFYTPCTPSARNSTDPRVAQDSSKLKYFQFEFKPPTGVAQAYGIYVHIPQGGTTTSGTTKLYPQRYYVIEVLYGTGQKYYETFDTYTAGLGFVRVGGQGSATNATFTYDGSTSIKLRIYNTVPRDANGRLTTNTTQRDQTDAQEQANAAASVVYADGAEAMPTSGVYVASPTAYGSDLVETSGGFRVTSAYNEYSVGASNGNSFNVAKGVVQSIEGNPNLWTQKFDATTTPITYGAATKKWRYSPLEESTHTTSLDNDSTGVSYSNFTVSTDNIRHQGANYLTANAVVATGSATPASVATASVTYQPTLDDGDYELFAYVGADYLTNHYAKRQYYEIYEGTTTLTESGFVDMSGASGPGWVKIGTRRYTHLAASKLKIILLNSSDLTTDNGKLAYADAIRFVGSANLAINSTPVHVRAYITPSGTTTPVEKDVVIVADESGKIHCLDYTGNGDGTTTEYWSYPSTADPNAPTTWADPNLVEGIDGTINSSITPPSDNVPTAIMPSGFDLSTATVARISGADYLYIAASNGRIYCLAMAGRGDYNNTTHKVGSTKRVWTFPDDYPATAKSSALGAIRGSLVYDDGTQNGVGPTIYVAAPQGRIYALDAAGNATTHVTTTRWTYPTLTSSTLASIQMTPTVEFGKIYFGTQVDSRNDGPGAFYCINAANGQKVWAFNGLKPTSGGLTAPDNYDSNPLTLPNGDDMEAMTDFLCGPVTISASDLAAASAAIDAPTYSRKATENTVYALNNNGYMYAFNADTGAIITGSDGRWFRSNEGTPISTANLTFATLRMYARDAIQRTFPAIVIPTTTGYLRYYAARVDDYDKFTDTDPTGYTGLSLGYYKLKGTSAVTASVANKFMYSADDLGNLYAFWNDDLNQGPLTGNNPPGEEGISANNPSGEVFRHVKVKLMTRQGYTLLQTPTAGSTVNQGSLTYAQATSSTYALPDPPSGQKKLAFEWGETAHVMLYNFPYATVNSSGTTVAPPQVEVHLTVDGTALAPIYADARQFLNPSSAPSVVDGSGAAISINDPAGNPYKADGYAVFQYTFQSGGRTSLPPGAGTISVSLRTSTLSTNGVAQPVEADPRSTSGSVTGFVVNNPLAISVVDSTGTQYVGTKNRYDRENMLNGSPSGPSTDGSQKFLNQVMATAGYSHDGQTATATINVIDRSLMTLIRPEGIGLDNIRVLRGNLAWQGKSAMVYDGYSSALYPNFNDWPEEFPNTSLDYPDIVQESVRVTKDPNGNAENPLLTSVTLFPVLNSSSKQFTENDAYADRILVSTPFQYEIDIPKYQPINAQPLIRSIPSIVGPATTPDVPTDLMNTKHNSIGFVSAQGYLTRTQVFVDSNGTGKLPLGSKNAYRSLNLAVGVTPNPRLQITTPTVELGTIAAGQGYALGHPGGATAMANGFTPWGSALLSDTFKEYVVKNDGNYNIHNMRLAKARATSDSDATILPWPFLSDGNDPQAWLDSSFDLWSTVDMTFGVPNSHDASGSTPHQIIPKPRTTDRVPTVANVNPVPRVNPNLPGSYAQNHLNPNTAAYPPGNPKVTVSVPIGFPVGTYVSTLRAVEDLVSTGFQSLDLMSGGASWEPYSDPTMTVSFTVGGTRLTGGGTKYGAKTRTSEMLDATPSGAAAYSSVQPTGMRDQFGSLVVGFASNRANTDPALTNTSIYLTSLHGEAQFNASGMTLPSSGLTSHNPIADLNYWLPASGSHWFSTPVAIPASGDNLVSMFGGTNDLLTSTVRFGSPAFPVRGDTSPLDNTKHFATKFLAFTGEAQHDHGATGRVLDSRVFVKPITVSDAGAIDASAAVTTVNDDPGTSKGRPSVLQITNTDALVFYGVTIAGQSKIHVDRYASGSFAPAQQLDFGAGFSSVSQPSASARVYRYKATDSTSAAIAELTFAGKLRGRPNTEVFLGRMGLDQTNPTILVDSTGRNIETPGAGAPFRYLPPQGMETLVDEGSGQYRARGVYWNLNYKVGTSTASLPVQLTQFDGRTGAQIDLLIPETVTFDRESGQMSFDTRLGGKVYIDPSLGTVRFASSRPAPGAFLKISYQPMFVRVTSGAPTGYSSPTGLFNDQFVSEDTMWQIGGSGGARAITPADAVRNDRYVFTYNRGANGKSSTARPYISTFRFGVRLPTRVYIDPTTGKYNLSVTGASGPVQVDAANGRVYVSSADEERLITVQYTGVNEATGGSLNQTVTASVGIISEKSEEQVQIDQAVNDSDVVSFLDPWTYTGGGSTHVRPSLIWLLYTSTRLGVPDVYFQTITPRFTAVPAK